MRSRAGTVSFSEGMTACNQRHRFFIIHRHSSKSFADVASGRDRVWVAVRAFRVDVDQAHLHSSKRILQVPVAGVALVVEPFALGAPVDILFRLPDVRTAATETECLEAHRFQCDVAGENHQISPRNLSTILLLDRPEQPARFIEVGIVWPTVKGSETLLS